MTGRRDTDEKKSEGGKVEYHLPYLLFSYHCLPLAGVMTSAGVVVRPGAGSSSGEAPVAVSAKNISPLRPLACTSPDVEAAISPVRKDSGGAAGGRYPSSELIPPAGVISPGVSPGRKQQMLERKDSAPAQTNASGVVSPNRRPLSERTESNTAAVAAAAAAVSPGRLQRPVSSSPYAAGTSPGRKDQPPVLSPVLPSDRISPPPARPPPDAPASAARAKSPPVIKEIPASPMPDRKPSVPSNDLFIKAKPSATEAPPPPETGKENTRHLLCSFLISSFVGGKPGYHHLATIPYAQLRLEKVIGDGAHGQVHLVRQRREGESVREKGPSHVSE